MISSLLAAERVVGRSPVTLPHRVRAFCYLSEATGCRASLRTGMPIPCSSRTAMSRRTPGTIKTARLSNHRCTTSSAARPSFMVQRCTASARKISGNYAITTAFLPPGPSPMMRWNRTTRKPSNCIRYTERGAKTPSSRRPARPIHTLRFRMSRAFKNYPTTSKGRATIPSTLPAGSCSTKTIGRSAPAFAAQMLTASRACCMPNRMRR